MKDYQTADIRNFAIVGHGGCGKTILSESILVNGGIINRIGSVEAGNTVSDYHPGEKDRQISIHAAPLFVEWDSKKFNFIDFKFRIFFKRKINMKRRKKKKKKNKIIKKAKKKKLKIS